MITDTVEFRTNQRKILKWVFLLLQEHHRRLGLKACAWSGPLGLNIDRISFFFHSVREPGSLEPGMPLTDMCIYQALLGVLGGTQQHPDQCSRELRTTEIVPWLDKQLGIVQQYHRLYGSHAFPYQAKAGPDVQQAAAWDAKADAYLLSWNVFGHWCHQQPKRVVYYSLGTFPWDLEKPAWIDSARTMFAGIADMFDILVLLEPDAWNPARFWLMTGHVVAVDGTALDLNVLAQQGLGPKAIAQRVGAAFPGAVRMHGSDF